MNKKVSLFAVLVVAVVLVGSFSMLSSVKACGVVPASLAANGPPTFTPGTVTAAPSGIVYYNDWGLVIPNLLIIGEKEYNTISTSTFNMAYNPKTEFASAHFSDVWTVVTNPTDGFKGYVDITNYNYNPSTGLGTTNIVNVFALGFGCFKGEALVLHYDGPNQLTGTWTGYVIMPW